MAEPTQDWDEWFEQVVECADAGGLGGNRPALVRRYYFMYEDYYEAGLTPEEAFEAEWGHL
jgi:hypothetical protein